MNRNFVAGFTKTAKLKKDVELKEHQKRVARKLNESRALLLFHGLGSGKTLSAINAIGDEDTDFVVPASLRTNASKELKKFTTSNKANVISYNKARKDELKGKNLVLDEAHRIGNADTATSKKIREIAPKYSKRILLTGSPIRNTPAELAVLHHVLNPESQMPLDHKNFDHKFIKNVEHDPGFFKRNLLGVKSYKEKRIKNIGKLRALFKGLVDYNPISKEDFPEVKTETIEVEMSPEQHALYKETMNKTPFATRYKIKNNIPLTPKEKVYSNFFLNSARQISNSIRSFGSEKATPKIRKAADDIEEELKGNPRSKTVSYSNFLNSGIKELSKELDAKGIKHRVFDGSLSDKKRKKAVDDYNSGKIRSLLLSGAGSEGLDLKGTRLTQILEPHWNNARTDQVKGRSVRYKSHSHLPMEERNVKIKNYVTVLPKPLFGDRKTATDEYMLNRANEKTLLNEQFLDVLRDVGTD